MRRDVLDHCHPIVAFVYFAVVLVLAVVMFHPAADVLLLTGALALGIYLRGRKAAVFFLELPVLIMGITTLINVLFVHRGITPIGWIGGVPLTKEALVYGFCAGLMTGAVLMWFYCVTVVMTSDKFIYLFGRIMPSASLMFTMAMRFVPRFSAQAGKIRESRKAIGCRDGEKVRNGLKTISVMTTWALENSIDTADSMRARGYGQKKRTHYSLFRIEMRDIVLLVVIAALAVICAAGHLHIICYPVIQMSGRPAAVIAVGVLSFLPVVLDAVEELKWRFSRFEI